MPCLKRFSIFKIIFNLISFLFSKISELTLSPLYYWPVIYTLDSPFTRLHIFIGIFIGCLCSIVLIPISSCVINGTHCACHIFIYMILVFHHQIFSKCPAFLHSLNCYDRPGKITFTQHWKNSICGHSCVSVVAMLPKFRYRFSSSVVSILVSLSLIVICSICSTPMLLLFLVSNTSRKFQERLFPKQDISPLQSYMSEHLTTYCNFINHTASWSFFLTYWIRGFSTVDFMVPIPLEAEYCFVYMLSFRITWRFLISFFISNISSNDLNILFFFD